MESTPTGEVDLLDDAARAVKHGFMLTEDLNVMAVFAALAEARNFRLAGERLGVSASAVSQALRKLERRLGVILAHRTSRSVRLTVAGERLYAGVRPALDQVRATVEAVGELGAEPRGTLRLHVANAAETFLSGPLLGGFLTAHPHVDIDVDVSNAPIDIVREGYDAGIRLGEVIDRDMIAVPVSGDLRLLVVGAPAYFAQHPAPEHPRDLAAHAFLNWHPTPDAPPYRWEFTEDGREFSVALRGRVLTTEAAVLARLARAGVGLAMLFEDQVREDVARGDLVPVLEAFSTPFAGFYLYYPERRHASPPLRALVDYLRDSRRPAPDLTSASRRRVTAEPPA
jgi:DNA-binding transcriptional LysR family regulator